MMPKLMQHLLNEAQLSPRSPADRGRGDELSLELRDFIHRCGSRIRDAASEQHERLAIGHHNRTVMPATALDTLAGNPLGIAPSRR